jgi:hypothetical protein
MPLTHANMVADRCELSLLVVTRLPLTWADEPNSNLSCTWSSLKILPPTPSYPTCPLSDGYANMYIHMYVYVYVCVCVYVYVVSMSMYVYLSMYMYVYEYVYAARPVILHRCFPLQDVRPGTRIHYALLLVTVCYSSLPFR